MLNDNEIIKALECCGKNPPMCSECGYKGRCNRIDCYDYLKRDALDLINRQKAKIDKMKAIVEQSDINCRRVINLIGGYERQVETAKTEALKEFAERLKDILEHFWEEENFVSKE